VVTINNFYIKSSINFVVFINLVYDGDSPS